MASIAWEHLGRLRLGLSIGGNQLTTDLNYSVSGVTTGNEADIFISDWLTANETAFLGVFASEVKFDMLSYSPIKPANFRSYTQYMSGLAGAISDEALPTNVGVVMQLRQLEVSGKHNGRFILPGVPETKTLDGLVTTGFVSTELAALVSALMTPVTSSGDTYTLSVVQRYESGIPIEPVGFHVSSIIPQRNLGTQRRRTTELREYHP